MAWDAGAITGSLGIDINPFAQGMLQATSIAGLFPSVVTSFLANPLLGLAQVTKDAFRSITETIESTASNLHGLAIAAADAGVSVEFLSSIGAATASAGLGVEGVSESLKFLSKNAYEAAHGGKEQAESFRLLGIGLGQVQANLNDTPTLLNLVSDGLSHMTNQSGKAYVAMTLMGKGGASSLAALGSGSAHIQALVKVFDQLGATVDTSTAEAASKFEFLQSEVGAVWMGIERAVTKPIFQFISEHADQIQGKLIEFSTNIRMKIGDAFGYIASKGASFEGVATAIENAAGSAFNFISSHAEEMKTGVKNAFDKIGDIFGTAGNAISGFAVNMGIAAVKVGDSFDYMTKHANAFKAALIGIGTAYTIIRVPAMTAQVAALATAVGAVGAPVLATGAAVGVLTGAVYYFRDSIATGLIAIEDRWIKTFHDLRAGFIETVHIVEHLGLAIENAFAPIAKYVSFLSSGAAGILHDIGRGFGIGVPSVSSSAAQQAVNQFASAGGAGGYGGSSFAGDSRSASQRNQTASGNVTIENVNVHTPFNSKETALEVAKKMQPAFQAANLRARSEMLRELDKQRVANGD